MTTKTRYFVIVSLLVLGVGLGTGLVAYYVGLPGRRVLPAAAARTSCSYVPRDASVVAYADVHEIMNSELRQKLRRALPMQENGQQEFQNQTGINIETDIDHVVAALRRRGGHTGRQRRRPRPRPRPLRRGQDRSADARARRARRGLQGQAPDRRRARDHDLDSGIADDRRHRAQQLLAVVHRTRPRRASAATRLIKSAIDLHKAAAIRRRLEASPATTS